MSKLINMFTKLNNTLNAKKIKHGRFYIRVTHSCDGKEFVYQWVSVRLPEIYNMELCSIQFSYDCPDDVHIVTYLKLKEESGQ